MSQVLRRVAALLLLSVVGVSCSVEPQSVGVEPVPDASPPDGSVARDAGEASTEEAGGQVLDDESTSEESDVEAPPGEEGAAVEAVEAAPPASPAGIDEETLISSEVQDVDSIAVPEIGETAWAVVVAGASDPFDPLLEETVVLVEAAGYGTTITNCDVGAAEAIGMQPLTSFTVSAYAASEQQANLVGESLVAAGIPGVVVQVLVECP